MNHVVNNVKISLLFDSGNNRRYINANKLYAVLGKELCVALPAFHALTGCDFNPASDYGWKEEETEYRFEWLHGGQWSLSIDSITGIVDEDETQGNVQQV